EGGRHLPALQPLQRRPEPARRLMPPAQTLCGGARGPGHHPAQLLQHDSRLYPLDVTVLARQAMGLIATTTSRFATPSCDAAARNTSGWSPLFSGGDAVPGAPALPHHLTLRPAG